jgi:hypothetical protein
VAAKYDDSDFDDSSAESCEYGGSRLAVWADLLENYTTVPMLPKMMDPSTGQRWDWMDEDD